MRRYAGPVFFGADDDFLEALVREKRADARDGVSVANTYTKETHMEPKTQEQFDREARVPEVTPTHTPEKPGDLSGGEQNNGKVPA